jgi:hypothetical protein
MKQLDQNYRRDCESLLASARTHYRADLSEGSGDERFLELDVDDLKTTVELLLNNQPLRGASR